MAKRVLRSIELPYWVIPAVGQWRATQNTARRLFHSVNNAKTLDRFHGVLGTRGMKPTISNKYRTA